MQTFDYIKIDFVGSYILIKYSLIIFDENVTSKQITDTYSESVRRFGVTFFFLSATIWPKIRYNLLKTRIDLSNIDNLA